MTIKLTIGELAKRIGINPKTIRYYEDVGLLHPVRAQNGYRIFSEQDESHVFFIKRAQKLGFTLSEIGTILQDIQDGLCNSAKSQIKEFINVKLAEIDNQILQWRPGIKKRLKGGIYPMAEKKDCGCGCHLKNSQEKQSKETNQK